MLPFRLTATGLGGPLVLAALLAARPLRAQEVPTGLEVSGFGGLYLGATIDTATDASGNTVVLGDAFTYGGRLRYNLSPAFGVEASYARAVSDARVRAPSTAGTPDQTVGTVTLQQYDLDLVLAYASPREALFAAFGAGATTLSPDIPGGAAGRTTHFAFNVGAGYQRFVVRALGIRFDARYRGVRTNRSGSTTALCEPAGRCYVYAGTIYSSFELTGGLVVRF
jgi:hypothetical protein